MDVIQKLLGKDKPSSKRLAIIQYERADFSIGQEEEFHWAIAALPPSAADGLVGPAWQVIDRHYSDERGVVWSLHDQSVKVDSTGKCLGGVWIGPELKGKDVEALGKLIAHYPGPTPKFEGWNCRSWVMEIIQDVLIPRGWADARITSQQSLFPSLKVASGRSDKNRKDLKRASPVIVDLELPAQV